MVDALRVGYLIGSLSPGGTERQLTELAAGILRKGHSAEVLAYDGHGFFDRQVLESGVSLRCGRGGSKLEKVKAIRSWFGEYRPEVVHGLMKRASSLAVLASLPFRHCRIVASDLSTATYSRHQPILWGALALFAFADQVATQTETNRRSLGLLAPWLKRKTVVIRNGVDTMRFSPGASSERHDPFRFLCVGTVYRVKNPVRVVEAARILRERGLAFKVDWVGSFGQGDRESDDYRVAEVLLERYSLGGVVRFLGRSRKVEECYRDHDALLHVSVQEGIPNAVVEGMACGLPVVVSRVSDLPLIVAEARNGFVCNEEDPVSIADAMQQVVELEEGTRREMAARSRELAVRWFACDRFVDEYEALYESILAGRPGRRPWVGRSA